MREIDPDVWLRETWNRAMTSDSDLIVIPDVRFWNEYDFLKEQGAIGLFIQSELDVRKQRPGYNPEFENDPTECASEKFDYDHLVPNNKHLASLFLSLDIIMERYGVKPKC